jgi:hypothetical protein
MAVCRARLSVKFDCLSYDCLSSMHAYVYPVNFFVQYAGTYVCPVYLFVYFCLYICPVYLFVRHVCLSRMSFYPFLSSFLPACVLACVRGEWVSVCVCVGRGGGLLSSVYMYFAMAIERLVDIY